jgi:hypothetical protein
MHLPPNPMQVAALAAGTSLTLPWADPSHTTQHGPSLGRRMGSPTYKDLFAIRSPCQDFLYEVICPVRIAN